MLTQTLYHTYKRHRTLQTDRISALPIVILMPHSACNCRCVMCDIWKGNHNLKQLTEKDIESLMKTFKKFDTKQVVMSGGEALLNPHFFRFCEMLRMEGIKVSLLSTGLTIKRNAEQLVRWVNDIIVSLDGDEQMHDRIRNIPGAFNKIRESVQQLKAMQPNYKITARTVIHRTNFRRWPEIIESAINMGLDQVSFLPADVTSHAFNREIPWSDAKKEQILLNKEELPEMDRIITILLEEFKPEFERRFIAESPEKIKKLYSYYRAFYGLNPFPYKKCNAPWVSTVVEADGTVRPCFFHPPIGNIHNDSLDNILNSNGAIQFRRALDMDSDSTCLKCVCYLNLSPRANV